MNTEKSLPQFALCILEEQTQLTLADLCYACDINTQQMIELVDIGVLDPQGREPEHWIFDGGNLQRARKALRLQRDLEINVAGVALILELLEEIETLRTRLKISGSV